MRLASIVVDKEPCEKGSNLGQPVCKALVVSQLRMDLQIEADHVNI
jgi:hypothetical protein